MRFRLIPREERFFELFVDDSTNVLEAARTLDALFGDPQQVARYGQQLRELEHRGDEISHEISRRLNSTFVTPFDREDIVALASALDDIVDTLEEIADTFLLYRIGEPTQAARDQARIIVRQVEMIHAALKELRSFKGLERHLHEVHRLENEGDRIARDAVADLFTSDHDPRHLIKWKDAYALLEECIDQCEDVADLIETIVVKHA
jgi:uncharacterized protein